MHVPAVTSAIMTTMVKHGRGDFAYDAEHHDGSVGAHATDYHQP